MTQQEYYELIKKQSAGAEQGEIDTLNKITESQKGVVKEDYGTQIADAETAYNKALDKNEVQRVLNERYIERKAAEMGLTDSGMNRTQQTAAQLSYANQRGDIELQRQKAVDTLAAAMNSKIVELENSRLSSEQQIRSTYDTAATKQATDLYNKEVEANAAASKAYIEAENDRIKQRNSAKSSLRTILLGDYSEDGKINSIMDFVNTYGVEGLTDEEKWAEIELLEKIGGIPVGTIQYMLLGNYASPDFIVENGMLLAEQQRRQSAQEAQNSNPNNKKQTTATKRKSPFDEPNWNAHRRLGV